MRRLATNYHVCLDSYAICQHRNLRTRRSVSCFCPLPMSVLHGPSASLLGGPLLTVVVKPPMGAEQRTFPPPPADVVARIDQFNAPVLDHSASIGCAVPIRRGAVDRKGVR